MQCRKKKNSECRHCNNALQRKAKVSISTSSSSMTLFFHHLPFDMIYHQPTTSSMMMMIEKAIMMKE